MGACGMPVGLASFAGHVDPLKAFPWAVQQVLAAKPIDGWVTQSKLRDVLERVERWTQDPTSEPELSRILYDPSSPKPRLILHVGLHKTGTTALQTALSLNAEALKKQGVLFPLYNPYAPLQVFGMSGNFKRFEQTWDHSSNAALQGSAQKFFTALRSQAHQNAYHTVILSSEDVFGRNGAKDRLIWEAAKAHFDVTTVAFVRELYAQAFSWFIEMMRGAGYDRIFDADICAARCRDMDFLRVMRSAEPALKVGNYNAHCHHLLDKFLSLASLTLDLSKLDLSLLTTQRVNGALGMSRINLLFLLKKYGSARRSAFYGPWRDTSSGKPARYYDPAAAAYLYREYAEDLRILNQHYLPADEQLPTEPHCPAGYTTEWDHDYFEADDIREVLQHVPVNTPLHAELTQLLEKCTSTQAAS